MIRRHDHHPHPIGIPVAGEVGTLSIAAARLLVRMALRAPVGKGPMPLHKGALLLLRRNPVRVAAEPACDEVKIGVQLSLVFLFLSTCPCLFDPVAHRPELRTTEVVWACR